MIKNKKQMYIVIGAIALVLLLGGVTYAFFNYTRTGTANVIKTGRIYFNSEQGTAINLTNMFPIDVSNGIPNDNTKVGTVTLNVTGDTTYDEGIEYLISAVNVQNTVGSGANAKSLPISINVSVASNTTNDPATTLGTSDDSYFDNRGGNSSIYKVLAKETISTNDQLLVGYITKGATGVDGNIVIKAYLDKAKIAITDTYDGNETDNMGTTSEWVGDREIFTTTEWNSLQANGVSFQIRVESNEGIWVDAPPKTATFDVGNVVNTKLRALFLENEYSGQTSVQNNDFTWLMISYHDTIELVDTAPDSNGFTEKNILSSNDSESVIYGWLDECDTINHTICKIKVYTEVNTLFLNEDSSNMFRGLVIENNGLLEYLDTSKVVNMEKMFYKNNVSFDFSKIQNWDVSNVTNMSEMFAEVLVGKNRDAHFINSWDVSKVTNFSEMFSATEWNINNTNGGSASVVYPMFTIRPGVWDNTIVDDIDPYYRGTYVPNN